MALADFTDLASVKAYGSIASTADDPMLGKLITACSAFLRSWLNRDVTTNSYDIRRSGRGTFGMQLPQYPITGITLLEIDGQTIPAQPAWGQPGYRFDDTTLIVDGYCFTRGVSNVHVQFTAGYATPPADIAQAVNEMVVHRYKMRDKLDIASKTLAGETVSFSQKDMPPTVKTLLNNWRCVAPL